MICPTCGTVNPDNALQCDHCEAVLRTAQPSVPAPEEEVTEVEKVITVQIPGFQAPAAALPAQGPGAAFPQPTRAPRRRIPLKAILAAGLITAVLAGGGGTAYYFLYWRPLNLRIRDIRAEIPADWQSFTSTGSKPSYSLRLPSGWQVHEFKGQASFIAADGTAVTLAYQPSHSSFSSFYEEQQDLGKRTAASRVLAHATYDAAGLSVEQTEAETPAASGTPSYTANTDILGGGSLFSITMTTPQGGGRRLGERKENYARIVSSFRINP